MLNAEFSLLPLTVVLGRKVAISGHGGYIGPENCGGGDGPGANEMDGAWLRV